MSRTILLNNIIFVCTQTYHYLRSMAFLLFWAWSNFYHTGYHLCPIRICLIGSLPAKNLVRSQLSHIQILIHITNCKQGSICQSSCSPEGHKARAIRGPCCKGISQGWWTGSPYMPILQWDPLIGHFQPLVSCGEAAPELLM